MAAAASPNDDALTDALLRGAPTASRRRRRAPVVLVASAGATEAREAASCTLAMSSLIDCVPGGFGALLANSKCRRASASCG